MKIKYVLFRITSVMIVTFLFRTTYSQVNFKQGYIINPAGDTLHGFIDYRYWSSNPDKIVFKENLKGENIYYTPLDIRCFSVHDELYESAIIKTEISPSNIHNLKFGSDLNLKKDTAFLQAMIIGEKSLYFYFNKYGNNQFYIKIDSTFELLTYKKYIKEVDYDNKAFQQKANIIMENRLFTGQLMLYLNDCPDIKPKIENTKYTKESMENLFNYYYHCTQSKVEFQKAREKVKPVFGMVAGPLLSTIVFNGDIRPDLVDAKFQPSINFSAGVSLGLIIPRTNGKWSMHNELALSSYKVNGYHLQYFNANKFTETHTALGYTYLKLINMARFSYPISNFSLFFNAGISYGYGFNETNFQKKEITFYSTYSIEEVKALEHTRKLEAGFTLGAGAMYKRYSAEFRYEIGSGMSGYQRLSAITNRCFLLIGYRF